MVGVELMYADRSADGRADLVEVMGAFREYANAPNKRKQQQQHIRKVF
jgi:hypothetical protein